MCLPREGCARRLRRGEQGLFLASVTWGERRGQPVPGPDDVRSLGHLAALIVRTAPHLKVSW